MADFEIAYPITAGHEGIYSNDPTDRGKETAFGITRINYPNWPGWKIIDRIKASNPSDLVAAIKEDPELPGLAKEFYHKEYWEKLNCSLMPQEIASEVYDTAVNQGKNQTGVCLQAALNLLNRNQQDYPDLKVDGDIGNKTLNALNAYYSTSRFSSRNTEKLTAWLLRWMNYFQLKRYEAIATADQTQEKWIPGWTERSA